MATVKGFALVCVVCGVACDATRLCAQCKAREAHECAHCFCELLPNERELCIGCAETAHYWSEMDEQLSFDF